MADKRFELEITLEEITLDAALRPPKTSRHLLGAALHWPRVGTARRDVSVALDLEKGAWHAAERPWTQRILAKDTVQGRFGFGITLTEALTDKELSAFIRNLAGQFIKFTGGQADDFLAPPLLGSLAELPLSYLSKALLKEKAPGTLAEGVLDLEASQLPDSGGQLCWEVPLRTPKAVVRSVRRRVGKQTRTQRETLLPAGAAAGLCRVGVRML